MRFVWFLPDWLARWADDGQNSDLRTAVPFVFLGFLIGIWLYRSQHSWVWWLLALLGLTLVVITAEVGQLTMPHRYFKWEDIGWGSLGSVLGLVGPFLLMHVNRHVKSR
ncbi:hypothetical protein GCM10027347_25060 [Larkinella harenae]